MTITVELTKFKIEPVGFGDRVADIHVEVGCSDATVTFHQKGAGNWTYTFPVDRYPKEERDVAIDVINKAGEIVADGTATGGIMELAVCIENSMGPGSDGAVFHYRPAYAAFVLFHAARLVRKGGILFLEQDQKSKWKSLYCMREVNIS